MRAAKLLLCLLPPCSSLQRYLQQYRLGSLRYILLEEPLLPARSGRDFGRLAAAFLPFAVWRDLDVFLLYVYDDACTLRQQSGRCRVVETAALFS